MRVGITFSTFDLLHAGHIAMLREAKEQCDYLICGLQIDPTIDRPEKNKPVQTIVERYTQLKGVGYVNEIIPYIREKDIDDILLLYNNINVRILGVEYEGKDFSGKQTGEQLGIEHYYNKRNHRFSSTDLRKRVIANNVYNKNITLAFAGIILIDCWGGEWVKTNPDSVNLYKRLITFLDERPVEHIVFATYGDHGEDRPVAEIFNEMKAFTNPTTSHITTIDEFHNKGLNYGKWLVAGQAWGECIHKRKLGIVNLMQNTNTEVYINPGLIDTKNFKQVQDNDIVFDIRVEWTKVGDYWRAHKVIEYSTNIDELDAEYGA
jgi:glycerol-3-phosphate cytidylyltransferase